MHCIWSRVFYRRRRGRAARALDCNPEDPSSSPTLTASWICFTENLSFKSLATLVNSQLVSLSIALHWKIPDGELSLEVVIVIVSFADC